jgi:hypothetical protein
MSPEARTRWARLLELVAGLAAGIAGLAGLGVYLFAPTISMWTCPGLPQGECLYENFSLYSYLGFGQAYLEPGQRSMVTADQIAAEVLLWVLPFLTVTVGALWDGLRRSRSGRVVLWVGTGQVLVATAVGGFVGTFGMFLPGALLALVASMAARASRQ